MFADRDDEGNVCVMDWERCTLRDCQSYSACLFRVDRCPRCGRDMAGEPAHPLDINERNSEWAGVDICLRCAEYLDPTEF